MWLVLIVGAIGYGVWHLANLPVPDDVRIDNPYGLMRVSMKDDTRDSYRRDDEFLYSSSSLFLGVRVRMCRRKLLNRRRLTGQVQP